jgi:hypothetical protein
VSRRLAKIGLVLGVAVMGAGCSTPKTAPGSLAQGKERVAQLVLDAAHALPATSQYTPPTEVGTQTCRKTIVGYAFGTTGAHRVELPLLVSTAKGQSATSLLARIEAAWRAAGYRLDRSRLHDGRFPQLRAHAPGGYDVVATALPAASQIDLYAVSPCLRGS